MDTLSIGGDYNHPDAARARLVDICDSLSTRFAATLHPLRANVTPFLFHAYNPVWEVPLDFRDKPNACFTLATIGFDGGRCAGYWRWSSRSGRRLGRVA